MEISFDDDAFFRALERKRISQGVSWREVGRQLALSPSTFSRLARGRRPDLETFLKLLTWLRASSDDFILGDISDEQDNRDSVGEIAALLRQDPTITLEDASALEDIVRAAYNRFSAR
jgi:transcriptional regulator with XRE-family HTH domain